MHTVNGTKQEMRSHRRKWISCQYMMKQKLIFRVSLMVSRKVEKPKNQLTKTPFTSKNPIVGVISA